MPEIPKPSGTVVVVRDGAAGLELLLLERTPRGLDTPGMLIGVEQRKFLPALLPLGFNRLRVVARLHLD